MDSKPLITVVTITYNSAKWVRHTIASILSQTFLNFELIICDDNSQDDSWKIINEFEDDRIRKYRNERNLGEYANRNQALSLANGLYILYIDGDDILYKNALAEYAQFIKAFPEAGGIWGVYSGNFDFVVFPYMFSPIEITKLNYFSTFPITSIGFTDSLFKVDGLRRIGGFSIRFAIGDTYIKRKFACENAIVLVPAGRAFWRQTENQASNISRLNFRDFIDRYLIDKEILQADYFPLKGNDFDRAINNFSVSSVKLLVSNTLLQFRILDFFRLLRTLNIPAWQLIYIFKKTDYTYKLNASGENPLMNNYNFTKEFSHADVV